MAHSKCVIKREFNQGDIYKNVPVGETEMRASAVPQSSNRSPKRVRGGNGSLSRNRGLPDLSCN